MSAKIMCVDDSISVLESLKWIFFDEPYYIFTFDSPMEALNLMTKEEFAVVLVENFISRIDGVEFMKRVKVKSPETIGIVMSGYTEYKIKKRKVSRLRLKVYQKVYKMKLYKF